jgi:hypothetical protein
MARLIVTPEAVAALDRLIVTHSLPADTKERSRRSIRPLEAFPRLRRGQWLGWSLTPRPANPSAG